MPHPPSSAPPSLAQLFGRPAPAAPPIDTPRELRRAPLNTLRYRGMPLAAALHAALPLMRAHAAGSAEYDGLDIGETPTVLAYLPAEDAFAALFPAEPDHASCAVDNNDEDDDDEAGAVSVVCALRPGAAPEVRRWEFLELEAGRGEARGMSDALLEVQPAAVVLRAR